MQKLEFENAVIFTKEVGPIATNVYLVGCLETKQAAIVDAGFDADWFLDTAAANGLTITKILQTHAHIDHVAAVSDVKAKLDIPIFLHPDDDMLWQAAVQQGMMFGFDIQPLPAYEEKLADGDVVTVGNLSADVMWVPGHSPGQVSFNFTTLGVALSGDLLFAGSIGRTDLPGSNQADMKNSLTKFCALPDDTQVLSGHGPITTIGLEKKRNPFLLSDW